MMLMGPDDNYDDDDVIETMIFQIVADEICADLCMFKAGRIVKHKTNTK